MGETFSSNKFMEYAYDLYQDLPTKEVNLVYVGAITNEVTRNFTIMTEENLLRHDEAPPVQRKVFNVMVETMQNISRHADLVTSDPGELRRGVVIISHSDKAYSVVTGNLVRSHKVEALKARLDNINTMDRPQLMAAYKKQITEGEISEAGGAGLGFLDVAKKSGQKIEYRFLDLERELPGFSFFMTICTILRKA